jgi:hypothetical protein
MSRKLPTVPLSPAILTLPSPFKYAADGKAITRALARELPPKTESAQHGVKQKRSPKPGSAAAWIDELYPAGEWRVMTGKQVHQAIDREAKVVRKLNKSPSARAVYKELADRRA